MPIRTTLTNPVLYLSFAASRVWSVDVMHKRILVWSLPPLCSNDSMKQWQHEFWFHFFGLACWWLYLAFFYVLSDVLFLYITVCCIWLFTGIYVSYKVTINTIFQWHLFPVCLKIYVLEWWIHPWISGHIQGQWSGLCVCEWILGAFK